MCSDCDGGPEVTTNFAWLVYKYFSSSFVVVAVVVVVVVVLVVIVVIVIVVLVVVVVVVGCSGFLQSFYLLFVGFCSV